MTLVVIAIVAVVGSGAAAAGYSDSTGRVCFDRTLWDRPDGGRPCARVRVYEDAGVRVTTGTANGARAYFTCSLPSADGGRPQCGRVE